MYDCYVSDAKHVRPDHINPLLQKTDQVDYCGRSSTTISCKDNDSYELNNPRRCRWIKNICWEYMVRGVYMYLSSQDKFLTSLLWFRQSHLKRGDNVWYVLKEKSWKIFCSKMINIAFAVLFGRTLYPNWYQTPYNIIQMPVTLDLSPWQL